MNIALMAHDRKKELMVQFCIAYCGIISRHEVCATGTTGKLVSEATGLKITCFMAGSQGGDQQISSRISCNEIDLLLYFRNPIGAKATEPDEASLLRLCDVYNIPYATNIASAEAMIHALENGDLGVLVYGDEGEGTLKRYIQRGNCVVLQPFNPAYNELVIKGDDLNRLHIAGRVVETKAKW